MGYSPVDACLVRPVRQAKLLETLATVWSLKRGSARVAPPAVSCETSHSVNQSLAPWAASDWRAGGQRAGLSSGRQRR